jgi:hypothetical protein
MKPFDALFHNATILTMHGCCLPEAVAVVEGKVAAVGRRVDLEAGCTAATRRIDLEGRTLIPGFGDPHAHIWKLGQLLTTTLDQRGAVSIEAMGKQLTDRHLQLPPASWLEGRGFNELTLADKRIPTRADLDRYVPDRPVLLTRTCGHVFVANSTALQMAGITRATGAPEGGVIERDEWGEPNGILHETAVGLIRNVLPSPSSVEYRVMIDAALRRQLSFGITASSDCGVVGGLLETYRAMDADGTLPARMDVMPLGKPDGAAQIASDLARHTSPMLTVETVKFLADGGLSGGTAALTTPYRNSTQSGVTRFSTQELRTLFQEYDRLGWRICTHAIGDAAIEQVLRLYEELPRRTLAAAHRMEHVGLPDRGQLQRMAEAGILVATQPIFLDELGANMLRCVPESLLDRIYPFRSMLDLGLKIAFSSDAPVVRNDAPLKGIEAAVTRRTAEGEAILANQAITPSEALFAYTQGAATVAGAGGTRGSIQPGRWADFAVLSANPLTTPIEAISAIRVEQTYLAGTLVYERS